MMAIVGLALIALGLIVAGTTPSEGAQIGARAVTAMDSVKLIVNANVAAARGERAKTQRDWIGWMLSCLGLLFVLIGLLS